MFEPSLVLFSCCLCLAFPSALLFGLLFKTPLFLMQLHPYCSDFTNTLFFFLTSGRPRDKRESNRKPHNLTSSLRCKETFEIPFKVSALPLNPTVRKQLLHVTCLPGSAPEVVTDSFKQTGRFKRRLYCT